MNKTSPWIIVSIIPIIGLCIGVFHRHNDPYRSRAQARWERKEARHVQWLNRGKDDRRSANFFR